MTGVLSWGNVNRRNGHRWIPSTEGNTPAHPLSNLQVRLAVDAQNTLNIDDEPVAPQQHGKSPEAEAATLRREFFKSSTQLSIVLGDTNVTNHSAINPQISARLAFADVELIPSRLHDSTFLSRR